MNGHPLVREVFSHHLTAIPTPMWPGWPHSNGLNGRPPRPMRPLPHWSEADDLANWQLDDSPLPEIQDIAHILFEGTSAEQPVQIHQTLSAAPPSPGSSLKRSKKSMARYNWKHLARAREIIQSHRRKVKAAEELKNETIAALRESHRRKIKATEELKNETIAALRARESPNEERKEPKRRCQEKPSSSKTRIREEERSKNEEAACEEWPLRL